MDYIFRVPEAYQREEDFNHMPAETVLYSDGQLPVLYTHGWVFSEISPFFCVCMCSGAVVVVVVGRGVQHR